MSTERLIDILTDIRDQQKQQIQNFERAIESQQAYVDIQRRSRSTFTFLIVAPWVAMALLLSYMLLFLELF